MLDSIKKFFDRNLAQEDEQADVDKILLASAALMFEVSKADSTIDDTETEKIVQIFRSRYGLASDDLRQLVQLAESEIKDATSLFQFTSLINEKYNHREKRLVLRNMWEVAFADGDLDRFEEHLIRKVADLLYLNHSDFIRTKLEVRNSMNPD